MTTEDQPAICRSVQSLLELGHALDRVIEDKCLQGRRGYSINMAFTHCPGGIIRSKPQSTPISMEQQNKYTPYKPRI
jgi:hypothetical protein